MKKILSILLILVIVPIVFLLQNHSTSGIYRKLDFSGEKSDANANKILYEYILKDQNMTPKEIEEFANITPESAKAFEVDLNDDGTNEIVGLISSTLYWGTAGFSLFILQKQPDGYKDISSLVFEPQGGIDIKINKTNGYYDLKLFGSNHNGVQYVAKYKDGMYQWAYRL